MKSFLFLLLTLGLSVAAVPGVHAETITSAGLSLHAGYRVDDLDWNIAGDPDGGDPLPAVNVLSELTWDNLEIFQLTLAGDLLVSNPRVAVPLSLHGSVNHGWIVDGRNQDSDFAGDNRTAEFSRSNNNGDGGYVWDLSAALGPQFSVGHRTVRLILTPLVGLSYHTQHLKMTDGFQTIPLLGPFEDDLNSRYSTQWWGGWTGVEGVLVLSSRFALRGIAEVHWADYYAKARWNLRTEGDSAFAQPKSFEHEGNGTGLVASLEADYAFTDQWTLRLGVRRQDWQVENGADRIFFKSGAIAVTRLNAVNWCSTTASLGMVYRFP